MKGNGCELVCAKDGHMVPVVKKDGRNFCPGSRYDGNYAAKRWAMRYVPEKAEYAVMFGMGDGQILTELAHRIPGFIMVYEPEETLYNAMMGTKCVQKLQLQKRIMIICGEDGLTEFGELVQELLNEDCLDTVLLLEYPGYIREYPQEWDEVQGIFEKYAGEADYMKGSIQRFVKPMIHNQLRNFPCMKEGVLVPRLCRHWPVRVPVVLVSAGPSLEKNIDELKDAKGRAFIFCADAALPMLLQHGIWPDLVGCTDAGKNMNCFEEPGSMDIPLLITTVSPVPLVHGSQAAKLWGDDLPFVRDILSKCDVEIPRVPSYLGVSTTLLAVALELGAEKIVLVGQDLAYSADGKSHISGRDEGIQKDEQYMAEGYYGGVVYSRPDWCAFREWMEEAAAAFPDQKIINATEGGARIRGTVQKSLRETLEEMESMDICFQNLLDSPDVRMTPFEFKRVMREFRKATGDLVRIRNMGYEETFFESDYMFMPVMRLVIHYMKSLEDSSRKARFEKSVEYVTACFEEIFEKK